MAAPTQTEQPAAGLSRQSLGYQNYLHGVLAQPLGSLDGFYVPQSPSMNFALRYQLAFGAYAVAALAQRTPAYRKPYVEALSGAIEKMLGVAAWGYWHAPSQTEPGSSTGLSSSGHIAVMLSPHQRVISTAPSDPIVQDNLQYSGHLSTMLGLYEKLSGDARYDQPFTLHDPQSGVSFTYTHGEVASRIYGQMRNNSFGGVCCESGMAYVPCNNHALASNALHDALHGTHYTEANGHWLRSVRDKMVLKGPALRGIFATCYVKDLHMGAPVAFNFTDAWGLAFMLPFDRPLVRKLYGKFRKRITREGSDLAYLGSAPLSEKMEISDVPINTGFALIAARGVGDTAQADALQRYADQAFGGGWQGTRYLYKGAPRTVHATALYALASAVEPGGRNFAALFNRAPDRSIASQPYLSDIISTDANVGVSRAAYRPAERILEVTLTQLDASPLPAPVTLVFGNINARPHVEANGRTLGENEYEHAPDGTLRLTLPREPLGETTYTVRV